MNDRIIPWVTPSVPVTLLEDEIHVWRVSLEQVPATQHLLRSLLSVDEEVRAQRFVFDKDRLSYIAAHGLLRVLLASYLEQPASAAKLVRFCKNTYGKPALEHPHLPVELCFNLSHSHNLVLLAFCYGRQIGVDVEYMRPLSDYESLAHRYFSPLENEILQALPEGERQNAFFQGWARKEAYIKARGLGLALPLDIFDVSLRPEEPARLLGSREPLANALEWTLYALSARDEYAAALAVEGNGGVVRCWQWSPELLDTLYTGV